MTYKFVGSSACIDASQACKLSSDGGQFILVLTQPPQDAPLHCTDLSNLKPSVCDRNSHVLGCALHDLHGWLNARAVQVRQLDLCYLLHRDTRSGSSRWLRPPSTFRHSYPRRHAPYVIGIAKVHELMILVRSTAATRLGDLQFLMEDNTLSCALETWPTLAELGVPDPFATPAAFWSSTDAGGVFRMNVKLRSCQQPCSSINMAHAPMNTLPGCST